MNVALRLCNVYWAEKEAPSIHDPSWNVVYVCTQDAWIRSDP
jgi:hypothetical protein